MLHSLDGESAVKDAVLFTNPGTTFAVYRAPTARAAAPLAPRPAGVYRENERLVVYQPVTDGDRVHGTLFVRWNLNPWYAEMPMYTMAAGCPENSCRVARGRRLDRAGASASPRRPAPPAGQHRG